MERKKLFCDTTYIAQLKCFGVGLCLAGTKVNKLTFGWPLDKHVGFLFLFLFVIILDSLLVLLQQTGMDLAEPQATPFKCLYGVSLFHFCWRQGKVVMYYMLYSHTDTDLGPLAHWDKVWIVKKQTAASRLIDCMKFKLEKGDLFPAYKTLWRCAAAIWKLFFGVLSKVCSQLQFTLSLRTRPLLENVIFNTSTAF